MQIALWFYMLFMLVLGYISYVKIKNYKDFALAGAKQGTASITFSMLASIVGSTATFGMVALSKKNGFPAFWWLGAGAFFLILQGLILSKAVRKLNAYSISHMAKMVINEKASMYISCIICLTWVGIIAAQFIALGQIVSIMINGQDVKFFIIIIALMVTLYTALGGQLSIVRTDTYQFLLIFISILLIFILLYATNFENSLQGTSFLSLAQIKANLWDKFELVNANFTIYDLIKLALLAGLPFFVGPDIFSRNLAAKDEKTAQKATFMAAIVLLIFSILMTYVALWVNESMALKSITPELEQTLPKNLLITLITDYLPLPLAILFALGLISALISSADTCLMSTAIILGHDILKTDKLKYTRCLVFLIASMALLLALYENNIITLLLGTYSVYVPGVVFPLAFSIYFYETRKIRKLFIFMGIIIGSSLGLCSLLFSMPLLSSLGIAISLLCSILGVWNTPKK